MDHGRVAGTGEPGRTKGDRPKRRGRTAVPPPDASDVARLVPASRAKVLVERLGAAADAFAAERFGEARRLLRPIVAELPAWSAARELHGLTLYRLGRWGDAARELEAFRELTGGSAEQHPVLADCYRALRRYALIDELWRELREASPSAELVVEGRIVAAGALADRGMLREAVRLLEDGWRPPRRPREHHLRRAYALADLHERAGDLPRARAGFDWVVQADQRFADAAERLAALR